MIIKTMKSKKILEFVRKHFIELQKVYTELFDIKPDYKYCYKPIQITFTTMAPEEEINETEYPKVGGRTYFDAMFKDVTLDIDLDDLDNYIPNLVTINIYVETILKSIKYSENDLSFLIDGRVKLSLDRLIKIFFNNINLNNKVKLKIAHVTLHEIAHTLNQKDRTERHQDIYSHNAIVDYINGKNTIVAKLTDLIFIEIDRYEKLHKTTFEEMIMKEIEEDEKNIDNNIKDLLDDIFGGM